MRKLIYILSLLTLILLTSYKSIDGLLIGNFVNYSSIPTDSLVAYYPFNGNANDESGNGHDGMVNGATLTTDKDGNSNSAYDFNGSSDYIDIAFINELSNTEVGTWCAWVKPTTYTNLGVILSFGDADAAQRIILYNNSNGTLVGIAQISSVVQWALISDDVIFADGTWCFVCLSHDGATPKLYANGLEIASTFSNSTDITAWFNDIIGLDTISIGSQIFNNINNAYYDGVIDEVNIYKDTLTTDEITALYNE